MNKIKFFITISILCLIFMVPTSFSVDVEAAMEMSDEIDNMTLAGDASDILTADYYFDSNAKDDSGDGSASNPYKEFKSVRIVSNSNLHLTNGVYTLDRSVSINNVTIIGQNPSQTILNYRGNGFTVSSSLTLKNLTLVNLRITNNGNITAVNTIFRDYKSSSYNGGVIESQNVNSFIDLNNCTFNNTLAKLGGSIYLKKGTLTIANSLLVNNRANEYGGSIAAENKANIHITDSKFLNSQSIYNAGGAIHLIESDLSANNLEINNCSAAFGGAITSLKSTLILNNFTGKNNNAKSDGGAIYAMYRKLEMSNSILQNNTALNAGAVFVYNVDYFIIEKTQFIKNQASNRAGAFSSVFLQEPFYDSILDEALHNTFSNNTASYENDVSEIYIPNGFIGNGNTQFYYDNYTDVSSIPSRYDLRELGLVTDAKNQGNEGNCWAFSVLGALESSILKANGTEFDFSEQNLKNLMTRYSVYGLDLEPNVGGFDYMGYAYLISWLGPVNESDDPYKTNTILSPVLNSLMHVQNILFYKRENYTDNDEIKMAVMKYGGVSTTMAMYQSKYFKNNKYYYCNGDDAINHVGLIVGWDDDLAIPNAPAKGAWIVKNSWGTDWGENGFYYVSYYDTKFALPGSYESFVFVLNDTINYDKNYQYDIPGKTDDLIVNSSAVWYKNKFYATDDEYLSAVSTYFKDNTTWDLSIYVNDKLKLTQSGFANYSYKTIELNQMIRLKKGDVFEVVFKVACDGEASFPISEYLPRIDNHLNTQFYTENTSYISYDGKKWLDLYDFEDTHASHIYSSQVACIKAFTVLNPVKTSLDLDVVNNFTLAQFNAFVKTQYGTAVKNGKVTFTFEGKSVDVDVKNGVASLTYQFDKVCTETLTAKFTATGFVTSSKTVEVVIDRISTKLTSSNVKTIYNSGKNIVATLKDMYGNPIKDAKVRIAVGSTDKTLTTNANGQVSLSTSGLLPNDYIAYITFDGNDIYKNSSVAVSVIIDKLDTSLKAENVTVKLGDSNGRLVATLTNSNGILVNAKVIININGEDYTLKTDSKGQASLSTAKLPIGQYIATVTYNGNNKYGPSNTTAMVTVNNKLTSVVSAEDVFVRVGDSNGKFTVSLTNSNGAPISTNVEIYLDGVNYIIKTDSNGLASIPTEDLKMGEYLATVTYNGNSKYNPSSATAKVTVNNKLTSVVSAEDVYVKAGDSNCRFVASLTNSNGAPISTNIVFNINGVDYTVKTDSKGLASISTADLPTGKYLATVTYKGNSKYNPSSTTATVTVNNKLTSIVSAEDVYVKAGDSNGRFTVSLTNSNGAPISTEIVVNLGGVNYMVKTNSKGQASIPTAGLKVGEYTATVTYKGNSKYNPSSAAAKVTVNNKLTSIVSAEDVYVKAGDSNGRFTVSLSNSNGNPISTNIVVNLNGVDYTLKTDSKGQASLSTAKLPIGEYVAKVTYKGNSKYNPSTATAKVTVNNKLTSYISGYYDSNNKEVIGTLTNTNGGAISTNVVVTIGNVNYALKSDSKGVFKVPTSNIAPGFYKAILSYAGNSKYNPSSATVDVLIA